MEMKWTDEQDDAITKRNTNIIVSAGAGSGKTAVLTERIAQLLKEGAKADQLLVLTFTNAAAASMKKKIIQRMQKDDVLKKRVDEVDNAYITTFDSYALSIVKKYHYKLNLTSNLSLIDGSVMNVYKRKVLNQIFDEYYQKDDPKFSKLLTDLTVKNDNAIKASLLNIAQKIDLLINRNEYLDNYIEENFKEEIIDGYIHELENILISKIKYISDCIDNINVYLDEKYRDKIEETYSELLNSNSYDDIRFNCAIKSLRLVKLSEEAKKYKGEIDDTVKEIQSIAIYPNAAFIKNGYYQSQEYVEIIIELLKEFFKRIDEYKNEHECFEFIDISKKAIYIVENFEDIRNELKYYYKEILVDEYQDTNDLQEAFVSCIANNNVYMVGDIKQSIYRFRNANPSIFKSKYDNYRLNKGGYKIDLKKNFRSNEPVLDIINEIFDRIMNDKIGNADYKAEHRMVFGQSKFKEESQDNKISYLTYENFERKYKNTAIEMFIVLKDIQEKIANKVQVFDEDKVRDCEYRDFAILLSSSTDFETIRRLLEYNHIPALVFKNEKVENSVIVPLIVFALQMIALDYKKDYHEDFLKAYYGFSRSFIMNVNDAELFDIINNKTVKDTKLYKMIHSYAIKLDDISLTSLIKQIIDDFEIVDKLPLIGDIDANLTRIEYIINIASSMEKLDMNIFDFIECIGDIFDNGESLEFAPSGLNDNKVKIMTIHKSKGLEFPINYFLENSKRFNTDEFKEKICFDNKYGIITSFYNQGEIKNVNYLLMKNKVQLENISEEIRLLYVALTRAQEQIIIISPANKDEIQYDITINSVSDAIKEKYSSFKSIYDSVLYVFDPIKKVIDIDSLNINEDYNLSKSQDANSLIDKIDEKIICNENILNSKEIKSTHASKAIKSLQSAQALKAMEYGSYIHEVFESVDFINPNLSIYKEEEQKYISSFLKQPALANIKSGKIYKEYEFIYNNEDERIHGIIDLMIIYADHIDIIDYKLKHVDDENYLKQLKTYSKFIALKTNMKVNTYLYSILDDKMIEVGI